METGRPDRRRASSMGSGKGQQTATEVQLPALHWSADWSYPGRMDQVPTETVATVGAYAAKTRLSELLDRVERGEQIIITRHGRPVARLVPERQGDRMAARAAVARLVALGERTTKRGINLSDAQIRALREEGRK